MNAAVIQVSAVQRTPTVTLSQALFHALAVAGSVLFLVAMAASMSGAHLKEVHPEASCVSQARAADAFRLAAACSMHSIS
jgi:hypothetical protein